MKIIYTEKEEVVIKKYLKLIDKDEEIEIDFNAFEAVRPNKRMIIKKNYLEDTNRIIEVLNINEQTAYLYVDEYGNLCLSQKNPQEGFYNRRVSARNHILKIKAMNDGFILQGVMLFRHWIEKIKEKELYLQIGDNKYPLKWGKFKIRGRVKGAESFLGFYEAKIPSSSLLDLEIHTPVFLGYEDEEGYVLKKNLKYKLHHGRKGRCFSSEVLMMKENNTSIYFRQSVGNTIYVTNRSLNITDYPKERKKLARAYYISKLLPQKGIIMYEKEASKFEESASVTFMRLIQEGYKDIFYVIDKNSHTRNEVPDYCEPYIIDKYSFKHYLLFFRAKAFVGTETPAHAMELRSSSRHVVKRLEDKNIKFVFLQHGVMYMVSLASRARKDARKGGLYPPKTKIVVSSHREAEHFVEEGNYNIKDLYVTGLPKFDKAVRKDNAKKIVLMPTWRPWDYNAARISPETTSYYSFVCNIVENIPLEYRHELLVLPHPLIREAFNNTEMEKYMPESFSYDEILKETDILITDYSSIAYDAFFRGAKVLFCWEEKDECMERYGGYLKLNSDNVFGDVSECYYDLPRLIEQNYLKAQRPEYIRRFKELVEFDDRKNTERLVKELVKDGIINGKSLQDN